MMGRGNDDGRVRGLCSRDPRGQVFGDMAAQVQKERQRDDPAPGGFPASRSQVGKGRWDGRAAAVEKGDGRAIQR